jgi:hypothetical protein
LIHINPYDLKDQISNLYSNLSPSTQEKYIPELKKIQSLKNNFPYDKLYSPSDKDITKHKVIMIPNSKEGRRNLSNDNIINILPKSINLPHSHKHYYSSLTLSPQKEIIDKNID